jgi:hypothetical protein
MGDLATGAAWWVGGIGNMEAEWVKDKDESGKVEWGPRPLDITAYNL